MVDGRNESMRTSTKGPLEGPLRPDHIIDGANSDKSSL